MDDNEVDTAASFLSFLRNVSEGTRIALESGDDSKMAAVEKLSQQLTDGPWLPMPSTAEERTKLLTDMQVTCAQTQLLLELDNLTPEVTGSRQGVAYRWAWANAIIATIRSCETALSSNPTGINMSLERWKLPGPPPEEQPEDIKDSDIATEDQVDVASKRTTFSIAYASPDLYHLSTGRFTESHAHHRNHAAISAVALPVSLYLPISYDWVFAREIKIRPDRPDSRTGEYIVSDGGLQEPWFVKCYQPKQDTSGPAIGDTAVKFCYAVIHDNQVADARGRVYGGDVDRSLWNSTGYGVAFVKYFQVDPNCENRQGRYLKIRETGYFDRSAATESLRNRAKVFAHVMAWIGWASYLGDLDRA